MKFVHITVQVFGCETSSQ